MKNSFFLNLEFLLKYRSEYASTERMISELKVYFDISTIVPMRSFNSYWGWIYRKNEIIFYVYVLQIYKIMTCEQMVTVVTNGRCDHFKW